MPATFPALSSGVVGLYPSRRTRAFKTRVFQFGDDTEQRFKLPAGLIGLARWELRFDGIKPTDVTLLRDFFTTAKGEFDTSLELVIDGVTYSNMMLDDDEFRAEERTAGRWNVVMKLRQWRKN